MKKLYYDYINYVSEQLMTAKQEDDLFQNRKKKLCIILCTMPDDSSARTLAQHLLNDKLAACVTLLPGATSLYCWKGMLEEQEEVQLVIKSHETLQQAVFKHIMARHPYKNPDLLVFPITGVTSDYLSWINDSLRR